MRRLIIPVFVALCGTAYGQTLENKFTRPLGNVLDDVSKRFGIRLKYDVDTTGLKLTYADFRIRPYSIDETLTNILTPFNFKPVKQNDKLYKVKPYEYARRTPEDGKKMIAWLTSLYADKAQWEARKDSLKKEVRARLGIDPLLAACSDEAPVYTKKRKFDGYTMQNFCIKTVNGHTVKGSVYAPSAKGRHPLIICPNGHFYQGRYGKVQALNGIKVLDCMIRRKDVDITRVGVNGGSGGGTQTVLLSVLDDRYTAACPVVSMSAWFDGGCPCESGMPIQLAGGGTCNAELAAMFAPRPMMIVSDGGDWTSTTPETEYPYLQYIYNMYGAKDKVRNIHLPKERHDFGPNKRNAVYRFFIDVFGLDSSRLDEDKVTIEKENNLRFNPKGL